MSVTACACNKIRTFGGNDLATLAFATDPDGTCQSHDCADIAAGHVANEEWLARFVHLSSSVTAIDESVFADCCTHGASTQRFRYGDVSRCSEIQAAGEKSAQIRRGGLDGRPPDPNRRYLGYFQLNAGMVPGFVEGQRAGDFRVYDTLEPGAEKQLHAVVLGNVVGPPAGKSAKEWRKLLRVKLRDLAIRSPLTLSPLVGDSDPEIAHALGRIPTVRITVPPLSSANPAVPGSPEDSAGTQTIPRTDT